jgi:uncharacterized protein DUF6445
MHETELEHVRLHIDTFEPEGDRYVLAGWVLGLSGPLQSLRVVGAGRPLAVVEEFQARQDVVDFYRIAADAHVGFRVALAGLDDLRELVLEVRFSEHERYQRCKPINNPFFSPSRPTVEVVGGPPALVVMENFYSDPDAVRRYALSLEFIDDQRHYKGRRTALRPIFPGTKELFERALDRRITRWENHTFNGVFQYCIAQDSLVYHCDAQTYAAMVYLSPTAPAETGTSFFRHRKNGLSREPTPADCERLGKSKDALTSDMFNGNHYDRSPWELLDVVGNVYNRLVIFDAKRVHAAAGYCGDSKENGRLFQIFFFDVAT